MDRTVLSAGRPLHRFDSSVPSVFLSVNSVHLFATHAKRGRYTDFTELAQRGTEECARIYDVAMKPHPRPPYIRKAIKWGGAALTVLLVVVWVGSGWFDIQYGSRSNVGLVISRGCLAVLAFQGGIPAGDIGVVCRYTGSLVGYQLVWMPGWEQGIVRGPVLPLWIPALLCLLITAWTFRLDALARRRARLNLCPKCHYDRTGLAGRADAVCPECGAAPKTM